MRITVQSAPMVRWLWCFFYSLRFKSFCSLKLFSILRVCVELLRIIHKSLQNYSEIFKNYAFHIFYYRIYRIKMHFLSSNNVTSSYFSVFYGCIVSFSLVFLLIWMFLTGKCHIREKRRLADTFLTSEWSRRNYD